MIRLVNKSQDGRYLLVLKNGTEVMLLYHNNSMATPHKFLSLIDDVTRFATLAISDFNGAYTFRPCFGFIRNRPCFPVFVLTNDFADTGFMLSCNRLKAAV